MLSQWCWAELAIFQELRAVFWNYWFEHEGELEGSCENLGILFLDSHLPHQDHLGYQEHQHQTKMQLQPAQV
jgi:hypothetical protein